MKKTDKVLFFCAFVLTVLLLSGQFFHYPGAVRDILTHQFPEGLNLSYPKIYVFLAPFFQFADHWTILSYKQHVSFLGALILGWIFLRIFLRDVKGVNCKKEIGYFLIFIFAVVFVVAVIILVPRPMAKLTVQNPDWMVMDFHSHTNRSWDARKSFTPEKNMEWHRKAGFHVSFITDHNVTKGAEEAYRISTQQPFTEVFGLRGEEVTLYQSHWIVLGVEKTIEDGSYSHDMAGIKEFLNKIKVSKTILSIAYLGGYWQNHWENREDFVQWGVQGFEIANAAPYMLDFPERFRREMIEFCRAHHLMMVGSSDHHGWGYTCYVWNILTIPNWRVIPPEELQVSMIRELKNKRFDAVRIYTRVKHEPQEGWFWLLVDSFLQMWETSRSMPLLQTVISIIWLWSPFLLRRRFVAVAKR